MSLFLFFCFVRNSYYAARAAEEGGRKAIMRKGKGMLLLVLIVGAMFAMTSCGTGNKNSGNSAQNQGTTQNGNGVTQGGNETMQGGNGATTGADNANAGSAGNNESATNGTNAGNNNNATNGANGMENGENGNGPLTNLGEGVMEGVDDLATDIGLEGNQGDTNSSIGNGTGGSGAGNGSGMAQ